MSMGHGVENLPGEYQRQVPSDSTSTFGETLLSNCMSVCSKLLQCNQHKCRAAFKPD